MFKLLKRKLILSVQEHYKNTSRSIEQQVQFDFRKAKHRL